ncbi:hypothetical protein BGW39_000786 [Mortierella sp. 14UC]|nr:hypothetical protein BGW39_000786 [Mortierella sp. 14UC]
MYISCRVLAAIAVSISLAYTGLIEALPTGLVTCLQSIQGGSSSYIHTPSSSMYNNDRLVFNNIYDNKPSAIFHPGSEADAAAAIVCAAAHSVSVVPRSGGHSFEGYSGGGKDGSLVIDLNLFQQFAIDHNTGIATVGAGTRLGPLYTRLWNAGEYLVPAGTCPSVGIGGHALGGGMGMVGRKYGMLSDNIVGLTMIDANGDIREVNATSKPDLFWALRGAGGGSFGLVTAFRIQAYKAPATVTTVVATYPWSMHRVVMKVFGTWAKTTTDDLTPMLYINQDTVLIMGTFLGSHDKAKAALEPLFALTGLPEHSAFNEGTWYDAAAKWAEIEGTGLENPITEHSHSSRARSLLYRQPISESEITTISRYLNSTPYNPNSQVSSSVIFEIWGGQIDNTSSPSVFDSHRGVLYSVQYGVTWSTPNSELGFTCTTCMDWSARFAKELQAAYSSGPTLEAYQNYIERDIPNGLQAYYGDNLPRLIDIKKSIDPCNTFTFPQAIPLK